MPKVLVIDDSPLVLSAMEAALQEAGFHVKLAADGKTALDLLGNYRPDVIVCDIEMPGMSGLEVLTECQRRLPVVPVLVHSGHGDIPLVVSAMRLGAFGYLLKGLPDDVLVREVRSACEHQQLLERNQALAEANRAYQENLERLVEDRTSEVVQLQNQKAQAEKLAALGTLVAGVAHEVNNPLAVIGGALNWIQRSLFPKLQSDEPLTPETKREANAVLGDALQGLQRIERIISGVRRLVHPGDKNASSDFWTVLDQVQIFCQPQLAGRARLELDIAPEIKTAPLGADELVTVLSNLVVNASHAVTPPDGLISITARLDSSKALVLEVKDNGCGIAPEHLSRVKEPFFTTKAPGQGTGLGLSLTSQIVQAVGGSLDIESEVGRGTLVRVRLIDHALLAPAPAHDA